jgi:hypothetical protein
LGQKKDTAMRVFGHGVCSDPDDLSFELREHPEHLEKRAPAGIVVSTACRLSRDRTLQRSAPQENQRDPAASDRDDRLTSHRFCGAWLRLKQAVKAGRLFALWHP